MFPLTPHSLPALALLFSPPSLPLSLISLFPPPSPPLLRSNTTLALFVPFPLLLVFLPSFAFYSLPFSLFFQSDEEEEEEEKVGGLK